MGASPIDRNKVKLLYVSTAKYGGDWHSTLHTHACTEIFYVVGGSGKFNIEGKLLPVTTDDMVIVNPNVEHTEVSYNKRPLEYIVLGVEGLEYSAGEDADERWFMTNLQNAREALLHALREMLRQTGRPVFSADGTLLRGVMVRHLVLPGCRHDSIRLLEELCGTFGSSAFLLSLMSQYSPEFAPETADANLRRRLTSFEYSSVLNAARQLGFSGYMQMRSASGTAYTPDFRNATF